MTAPETVKVNLFIFHKQSRRTGNHRGSWGRYQPANRSKHVEK